MQPMKLHSFTRCLLWPVLILAGLLGVSGVLPLAAQDTEQDHVARLSIDGGIGPATTDYLLRGMEDAQAQGATTILLRMDTPGGLDAATRDIVRAILQSPIPVMTYVHPAGARAASAGTYIMYASHIAAMTASTNLGAATPVQMGGSLDVNESGSDNNAATHNEANGEATEAGDEEADGQSEGEMSDSAMERKIINDSVAYIRGLAERHNRNADWAEKAVREGVSVTASEALALNVIDIIATDAEDLLAQADGRVVQMEHSTQILQTANLPIIDYEPDWRNELLSIITSPQIAYILLLVGIYGLILEGYNPGGLVPGVIGAISLLVALYALQMLPLNYAGLGLIVLGALLILAEAFVPSFGILGIGGVAALVLGSVMLIDSDIPGIAMPWEIVGVIGAVSGLMMLYIVVSVARSMRIAKVAADQAMVGLTGKVRSLQADHLQVMVNGEIWQARAPRTLDPGQNVRVTAQEGLTLNVQPIEDQDDDPEEGTQS